ncbi:hypothetical protein GCM10009021_05550 [Halarchaeum nitratireducens]|uniref:Uncharacterized protein n=1 Tax=Halarchaeum nitratireducens TaxID=489913 RepID=A0A830G8Y2_9EURY|nr:hypothetical protein GCM10009021_05550 [Halarchaeum nitratireducens]
MVDSRIGVGERPVRERVDGGRDVVRVRVRHERRGAFVGRNDERFERPGSGRADGDDGNAVAFRAGGQASGVRSGDAERGRSFGWISHYVSPFVRPFSPQAKIVTRFVPFRPFFRTVASASP